jgi:hypothetical protein
MSNFTNYFAHGGPGIKKRASCDQKNTFFAVSFYGFGHPAFKTNADPQHWLKI